MLLCGVTLVLGYVNKDRCTGPTYDRWGRTSDLLLRSERDVCYSDIQYLWIGRDIDRHVFPYVHGGIDADGQLYGGTRRVPGADRDADVDGRVLRAQRPRVPAVLGASC